MGNISIFPLEINSYKNFIDKFLRIVGKLFNDLTIDFITKLFLYRKIYKYINQENINN